MLGPTVIQAIDHNPNSFLILVYEAAHMNIGVSNDQLQEVAEERRGEHAG